MPDWATAVVALAAAGVGGVLGSWMQVRHERAEAWRTRLLGAADEFGSASFRAATALRDARQVLGDMGVGRRLRNRSEPGELSAVAIAELDKARDAADDVHTLLSRIELLFGSDSDAYKQAEATVVGLRATHMALRADATFHEGISESVSGYNVTYTEMTRAREEFARAARAQITPSGRWAFRRRPASSGSA